MSSLFSRHPEQNLVGYLDGALSPREAGKMDRHLASCSHCRAELDELQSALADCASYQEVRKAQLEAPEPWRDLYRDFSRIDESLAHRSFLVRLTRPLVHSGVPRWSFVAGLAVLIVLISLNQLRQAPSVQAATMLRKAVEVAENKPRPVHRIRVRSSRSQEFTRLPGAQGALMQAVQAQAIGALFQSAHFDWNDPLSARAFEQWRDQQVHKTDEVNTVKNPAAPSEKLTQIRTVSTDSELETATLTLDPEDYPVAERLEFRDQEWVELSEIAENSTENGAGTSAAHVEAPVRAAEPPSRPAAFSPGASASISDELQVLSALSSIGADLGEIVEVNLSDGKVKVTGEGLSPRRQAEIRNSVADNPRVEVDFSPATPVVAPTASAAPAETAASAPSAIQLRLEKHLGSHAEFDRFSAQVLDLDQAAMDRVYAVHRMAQKFPAEDEQRLSPNDVSLLHELTRKHTAVLADRVGEMERILAPALSSLGGTAASVSPVARASWQQAAEDVFNKARRVEILESQMLGMSSTAPGSALPSELLSSLKELRASLADCQKLLAAK